MRRSLKEIRLSQGLYQIEVAERSCVTQGYCSLVENGLREPTVKTANRMAAALSITLDEFNHALQITTKKSRR